jgi:predicted exporter
MSKSLPKNLFIRPLLLSSTTFSVLALFFVLLNGFVNVPRTSIWIGSYAVFGFIVSLLLGMLYLDWLWKSQYMQQVDEIKKLKKELEAQRRQAEDSPMSESQLESMGLDYFLKEDAFPTSES